ncbi:hypothetical protein H4F46_19280 [Pectobacterium brasiliense]|uniref:hypothetical protein n=1 Tax=Pectobacterium brasiliense TaxID=180957 RepID=UPI001968BEBF|nr:hypothetical protein [Pectobacterium brasiliense]MBN3117021.1 hypothetical protein [Pectobacterium brasiliense]
MESKKNSVLIVNYYGNAPSNPGGRRTLFWTDLFTQFGYTVDVSSFRFNEGVNVKSFFSRLITRALGFFKEYPAGNYKWLQEVHELIRSGKYEKIVICVPIYEVCELLAEKNNYSEYIVDIRDGIFFETLFTPLEKIKFSKRLKYFESLLKNADVITSNIPGLQCHYSKMTGKNVFLLLNSSNNSLYIKNKNKYDKLNILYAGGLMRSSWGQNIYQFLLGVKKLINIGIECDITIIGRLNFIEKIFYKFIFSNINVIDEIPLSKLENSLMQYNCMLLVNTTKRDLLPSKIWLYTRTEHPIISIGGSYSLLTVMEGVPGFFNVDNDSNKIFDLLSNLNLDDKYNRLSLNFDDDMSLFKSNILNEKL